MNINYDALKELSSSEPEKDIISNADEARKKLSEILSELSKMDRPSDIKVNQKNYENAVVIDTAIKKIKNVAEALYEIDNFNKQKQPVNKPALEDISNHINVMYNAVSKLSEDMSKLNNDIYGIVSNLNTITKYLEKLSENDRKNALSDIMDLLLQKYPLEK
jgi:uncharacterized protein YjgD (DUF1641 family)